MKDAYSFDIDKAGLDKSFELHDAVYRKIFSRCGLKFVAVEADSGSMGGSQSQEFMVYTDAGEDLIASCPVCGYAANTEKATSLLAPVTEMEANRRRKPELVFTPGCGAIADVAAFFKMAGLRHQVRGLHGAEAGRGGQARFMARRCRLPARRSSGERDQTAGSNGRAELRTMQAEELDAILQRPGGLSRTCGT
jgi:prolyl-tRNA synthetase